MSGIRTVLLPFHQNLGGSWTQSYKMSANHGKVYMVVFPWNQDLRYYSIFPSDSWPFLRWFMNIHKKHLHTVGTYFRRWFLSTFSTTSKQWGGRKWQVPFLQAGTATWGAALLCTLQTVILNCVVAVVNNSRLASVAFLVMAHGVR